MKDKTIDEIIINIGRYLDRIKREEDIKMINATDIWLEKKLKESRESIYEILKNKKWKNPEMERDLERVVGQLTYWIDE